MVSSPPAIDYWLSTPTKTGEPRKVVDGLYLLRLPIPDRLDHVNSWLLEDERGWLVIDCGLPNDATAKAWDNAIDALLRDKPVRDLLVTHAHIDHIGHIGPLISRYDVVPRMSQTEYLNASLRVADTQGWSQRQLIDWLAWCGGEDGAIQALVEKKKGRSIAAVPRHYRRMAQGDVLSWGGREWRVMTFGGHAPEMIGLYCPEEALFITADQVLPEISPSIAVQNADPTDDPLATYLATLSDLARLPPETLVLPSHGMPFKGLHDRLKALRSHHEERLDQVQDLVGDGMTTWSVAEKLFSKAMAGNHARLALSETLAHLNYLTGRGRLERRTDDRGAAIFHS